MIAVGNVVGSNICNIALILGAAATLVSLTADKSVIRRDIPLMLAISILLLLISLNSKISRGEGVILFAGIIIYTLFNYKSSFKAAGAACMPTAHPNAIGAALDARGASGELSQASEVLCERPAEILEIGIIESRPKQIALIIAGIAGVVIGAQVLVDSAVLIMKALGVSEKLIGLTIVAVGTSLPELATSIVAALRKEMDISIGNLIGSNVFNILAVIGLAAMVRPISIPGGFFESGLIYDYLVMMVVSFLPFVLMYKDNTIRRGGGLLLLACYIGYMGYLVYNG
jgi:cation:H+ antiporter